MKLLSKCKSLVVRKGPYPYRVPFGLFGGLTLELDLAWQTQVYLGLWERETYPFIRLAAARCRWAVDIGAGRGELCVFLLKHSQVRRLVAVEPQVTETDALSRNVGLNGRPENVTLEIINKFIGRDQGDGFTALDALGLEIREPGFIKIDVDGAEMDVLRSGARTLRDGDLDILLETHSKELEDEAVQLLRQWGYVCRIIPNAWWRWLVPEHRPIAHNRWLWVTRAPSPDN